MDKPNQLAESIFLSPSRKSKSKTKAGGSFFSPIKTRTPPSSVRDRRDRMSDSFLNLNNHTQSSPSVSNMLYYIPF